MKDEIVIDKFTNVISCKKCNRLLFAGDFQKVHFEGKILCACGNVICIVCGDTINKLAFHVAVTEII